MVQDDKVEHGYLYLEECEVFQKDSNEVPVSKWMDVTFRENSSDDNFGDAANCAHCKLVVDTDKATDGTLLCLTGRGLRFEGMIQDVKPDRNRCRCQQRLRQRTDAALVMGLALTCQDLGHISIKTVRIAFQQQNDSSNTTSANKHRQLASLYITFHIPEIQWKTASNRRRFISNSPKILPPSTQLLLSLMRSDWDVLETFVLQQSGATIIPRKNPTRRHQLNLFPPKLSLHEVYERIGGAACVLDEADLDPPTVANKDNMGLIDLPKDALKYHVAVYLKARSLDSLRRTCKSMHRTLHSVVPGLKLQLYAHQIKSLSWMRNRETKVVMESDLISYGQRRTHSWEGDAHRAASGGASVLLTARNDKQENIPISQYDGNEIVICSNDPLSRAIARGGLLCDDPGLGKTITVVSLILQTLGLSTESSDPNDEIDDDDKDDEKESASDERIFSEYWKESIIPEYRYQYLNKLLNDFQRSSHDASLFIYPVDPIADGCPDYLEVIKDPISIQDIRSKITAYAYGDSFAAFEIDMEKMFSNAKRYNPVGSVVHDAAIKSNEIFRKMVQDLKERKIQVAKKSFAKASAKPNSTVAALVVRNNRLKLKKSLAPSSGTLLVVPSVLLEHWQDQLRLHVDLAYCTNKVPIIFHYTGTNRCAMQMEEIVYQCRVKKTHFPLIFVDKTGTKKLPSAHFLSMFSIAITTNQRFTNEWKNGSFEDELKRHSSEYQFHGDSEEACPLLKVNWLRMIVDEGHSMGRGKDNSAISFASWITAERRWAMTGTPTRQTLTQSGLSSIHNLMEYLQHGFFSRRQNGDGVWQNLVTRGWNRGQLASFFRVRTLLSLLMVRHTKMDIEELPLPRYHTTVLSMSAEEVTTYNTLVCAVQSNLLITSMEGKTSGAQDSLLHKSQARHAKKALENVRLVCAGGTQVLPTLDQENWTEFIRDFELCNPVPQKLDSVKQYLSRAVTGQLSPCGCCGMMLSTLLVFPCGDLVCTECVDHETTSCIVCNARFDVDLFQRLQPGMVYNWLHNVEEELKGKKSKLKPEESDSQTNEEPAAVVLEGGAGILAPVDPSRPRRRTRKPGDGHACDYSPKDTNGECLLCWKQHDECDLTTKSRRCEVCYRSAEGCPTSETKSFYVVKKLIDLHKEHQRRDQSLVPTPLFGIPMDLKERRPLKVIVFSQFRKVLNMTGDRLLRRFGSGCIAEYWGSFRRKELHKFIHDANCFCMLLGKDGSEGLDLSFVTHIFFMEQVWDKSLEQQAVARAWRMGAQGSVQVETLVAKTSVEETMSRLEKRLGENDSEIVDTNDFAEVDDTAEGGKSSEYQRAKLQFLLKGLSLIPSPITMPFEGNKRKAPAVDPMPSAMVKKPRTVRRVRFDT